MLNRKYNKDTFFICLLTIPLSILINFLKFSIFPAKYFYDSTKILYMVNLGIKYDDAYNFVSNIYSSINLFGFDTLLEWSTFITIIFSVLVFFILIQRKKYSFLEYIFIYASVVLFNMYVFIIGKDIIQFCFFLLIFLVLRSNLTNLKKLLLISIILLYEALNFRIYYGIMIILIWTFYYIYNFIIKKTKISKKFFFKILFIVLIVFFLQIFLLQFFSYDNYLSILDARYGVNFYRENDVDSVTIILDLLGKNNNIFIFIGNYLINFVRMLIPVELFLKGVKYIPFVLYQIFISFLLVKTTAKINDKNSLYIFVCISFFMISVIFEPDFGSFIRHECAIFLFLLELLNIKCKGVTINE